MTATVIYLWIASLVSVVFCDEYFELMRNEVGVRVLPLRIEVNSTEFMGTPKCALTLHRKTCTSAALTENETISWSTKICFQWKCDTPEHAMHVSNCWIGSIKNPVYLIKDDGCTGESALLRSPSYHSFSRAISVGWLSVREQGMTNIYVQCDVTLCHLCDPQCQIRTPPRYCRDVTPSTKDYGRMWNESSVVDSLCNAPLPTETAAATVIFINYLIIVIAILVVLHNIQYP